MIKQYVILIIAVFVFAGCADFNVPTTPEDVLQKSLGSPSDVGTTKGEIISEWGEPDDIIEMGEDRWGAKKEKWMYYGRYPEFPVNYKFVSKTKIFIFRDDVLTEAFEEEVEKEAPAKEIKKESE